MRLRNIPGSREAIAESRWCVQEPEQFKGNWNQIFGNRNPIHIEIGMGKGRFLMANAQEHPQTNYIGIEKYSSVLLRALQKMEDAPLENIRFIRMEAESITDIFEEEYTWMLSYGENQVLLLQKKDLAVGNTEDFMGYVQERRGAQCDLRSTR